MMRTNEARIDFYMNGKVILETKAAEAVCKQREAQVLAYLEASGSDSGILLDFGETSLNVRRLVNKGAAWSR